MGREEALRSQVHGMLRTTYLIDPEGKVEKVWTDVKPAGHAHEVLSALSA